MNRVKLRNLVSVAAPYLSGTYDEAVSLGAHRLAEWWREAFFWLGSHFGVICPTCYATKEPDETVCEGCQCIAEDAADMESDGDR